tara:strand:- start:2864 stop:3319 length:456 start_codon:yes stop_codon:yes gene_type:complete
MILFLASMLLAQADEPKYTLPPRPNVPEKVDGQCERTIPVTRGRPLPESFRISPSSSPCSGVVVPLSDYADLLATEEWAKAVNAQYKIDIAELQTNIEWHKYMLEEATKPIPWMEKPSTQRWFGRIETLAVVVVVSTGLGATYYYTSGAGK